MKLGEVNRRISLFSTPKLPIKSNSLLETFFERDDEKKKKN